MLIHHVLGVGGRVLAIRALTPVAVKGIVRNPELKLGSWITRWFQEDAEIILFRLGLYRELADILRRRGAAVHSLDSARLFGQLMFDLGEFEVAHKALSQWTYDPFFRSAPDLLQLKASLDLIVGREEDAVPLLNLATTRSPRLAAPQQNMAARTPAEYLPTTLDTKVGHLGYLYDAYNLVGQRVTHVGGGHLGAALYARALSAQKRLRASIPEISFELRMLLLDLGIELEELRILPPEWVTQIGHEAMADILFRMRDLGWWQGKAVLLAPPDRIANRPFLNLLRDFCHILSPEIDIPLELYDELISLQRYFGMSFNAFECPGGEVVPWQEAGALAIRQWEAEGRSDILRSVYDRAEATPVLAESFQEIRRRWGMRPEDWFVCLHIRDAAHYGETGFMGQDHRNAHIKSYAAAARYITSQGGWVIKLGGPASPKLPSMERVIEYGRSRFKSEMMDLYLIRHCRYFIGTTSGLTNVAISFGVPSALVNCITTDAQLWGNKVRFLLKRVRKSDGQLVTQREFTSAPWRWRMFDAAVLRRYGATVIENSAEEILDVVKEVDALATDLESNVVSASGEPALLDKWRRCLEFEHFYGNARPSLRYLQANEREFLGDTGDDNVAGVMKPLPQERLKSAAA